MHNDFPIPVRHCIVAVTWAFISGCSLFEESDAEVRLTAHTPLTVRLGDSVAVRVTIENLSDVTVAYQGNLCPRFFRVVSSSGEDAGPPFQTIACPAIAILRTLAAGEQHEYVRYWQARAHGPRFEPISVQPGRYRVEPVMGVERRASGRSVDLRYAVSTITVVE